MNVNKLLLKLCCLGLMLTFFVLNVNALNFTEDCFEAEQVSFDRNVYCSASNDSTTVRLETEKREYLIDEDLTVSYLMSNEVNIASFTIVPNGFNINSAYIDVENTSRLIINFDYLSNCEEYYIDIFFLWKTIV